MGIEKKIERLRRECSQTTEETRSLTNNTKPTKKTKDQQEVDGKGIEVQNNERLAIST